MYGFPVGREKKTIVPEQRLRRIHMGFLDGDGLLVGDTADVVLTLGGAPSFCP